MSKKVGKSKDNRSGKSKHKAKSFAEVHSISRQVLITNYMKICKSIGIVPNYQVNEIFRGMEDENELEALILDNEDCELGPGGVRAMTMAILGDSPTLCTGPYLHIKSIRLWKIDVGDDGASAIASLLNKTKPISPTIAYLELLDCNIGDEGCKLIAKSLHTQKQEGLLTLDLKYNKGISDEGVAALCEGLFNNTTLKRLHLDFCSIGSAAAVKLAQLLSIPSSTIHTLTLKGNTLKSEGLNSLSRGLARSRNLATLNISDNCIRYDEETLTAFRDGLIRSKSLMNVDFTHNVIGVEGAEILFPVVGQANEKLKTFLVDSTLPREIFKQLNKVQAIGGKKTKGKKGGKKK